LVAESYDYYQRCEMDKEFPPERDKNYHYFWWDNCLFIVFLLVFSPSRAISSSYLSPFFYSFFPISGYGLQTGLETTIHCPFGRHLPFCHELDGKQVGFRF